MTAITKQIRETPHTRETVLLTTASCDLLLVCLDKLGESHFFSQTLKLRAKHFKQAMEKVMDWIYDGVQGEAIPTNPNELGDYICEASQTLENLIKTLPYMTVEDLQIIFDVVDKYKDE